MSVTPEEKLKLMLELGLEDAASKFAEANNLTTLKFRSITEEKIKDLLSVEYQEKKGFDEDLIVGITVIAGIISTILGAALSFLHAWILFSLPVLGAAIGTYMGRPRMVTETAEICDMPLQDWEDNLPYGALLAVKEAKQQKFQNFRIFFPAKQGSYYGRMQRLKNDPIIVARKKNSNKLYNIFAWDDSKLYE